MKRKILGDEEGFDCLEKTAKEEALRESGDLFRFLVENMQVGLVLQGPGAEILLCNDKALELLGLTKDQLLGVTSFDPSWNVIHEDGSEFPGSTHPVPRCIAEKRPVLDAVMGVWRPVPGDRVWILVDAVPRLDPNGAVRDVICTFREITRRKMAEDRVRALLEEKELILREVHHRIKNNMAVMMGLLSLQANLSPQPAVAEALEKASGRLRSMALLYEHLYQSQDHGALSLAEYLPSLAREIVAALPSAFPIDLVMEVDEARLDAKRLSSLGIIVNELVTNAVKYAFAGRAAGRLDLVARVRDGRLKLEVRDDGIGLPTGFDPEATTGFGLRLIDSLAKQLDGSFSIGPAPKGGSRFLLDIPL